jgi:pimeloyl-ACP methyl ester carboxylesterase
MPALADQFDVIAPDYPGFGNSDMPDQARFSYTFERTSEIIESFLEKVGYTHFGLYIQVYGGPIGFRIITRRPDFLEWLIIQNTNAYEVGFTSCVGRPARRILEKSDARDRKAARSLLAFRCPWQGLAPAALVASTRGTERDCRQVGRAVNDWLTTRWSQTTWPRPSTRSHIEDRKL